MPRKHTPKRPTPPDVSRIYSWTHQGWKQEFPPQRAEGAHFLIRCTYGDWSGFRTLHDCLAQNPDPTYRHDPGFFWIEER